MTVVSKDLELLKALGLSELSAQLYLWFVKNPEEFTFDEVLASCKVPPEQAREALQELVEKGFVKVRSNRFSAVQPKLILSSLLERREAELRRASDELRFVVNTLRQSLEPLYQEVRLGIRPEEILESLESLSAMESRTAQMIERAREKLSIFVGRFDWHDRVRDVLARALERGVETRVLMRIVDDVTFNRATELKGMGALVRKAYEEYLVRGTLIDEAELIFVIWVRKDVERPVHFRPCYTKNVGFIKMFSDAFELRWSRAEEVD